MENKQIQPSKIMVIEYKGQLFKTQEEYAAYKRNELKETLYSVVNSKLKASQFIAVLLADAVNTKAKLEALQKEIELEDENDYEESQVKTQGVNCNEEPEDGSEKEVEKF